jgi:CubicO group peptidase (beta-lactamase class C family)
MCHSVRKSLLSALYGIHVDEGTINLDKTLEELNIDDQFSLTKEEKQAVIRDLLKSRSGVYHPAAYETTQMKDFRLIDGYYHPEPENSISPAAWWRYHPRGRLFT